MIRVTTASGQMFIGRDRADVIRQMRDAAWMHGDPKREYMAAVADRVWQQTGMRPGTSVDDFIEDLTAMGYIRVDTVH